MLCILCDPLSFRNKPHDFVDGFKFALLIIPLSELLFKQPASTLYPHFDRFGKPEREPNSDALNRESRELNFCSCLYTIP